MLYLVYTNISVYITYLYNVCECNDGHGHTHTRARIRTSPEAREIKKVDLALSSRCLSPFNSGVGERSVFERGSRIGGSCKFFFSVGDVSAKAGVGS